MFIIDITGTNLVASSLEFEKTHNIITIKNFATVSSNLFDVENKVPNYDALDNIIDLIKKFESSSREQLKNINLVINSQYIKSYYIEETMSLHSKKITCHDINNLINLAKSKLNLDNEYSIISSNALNFTIDGNRPIDNPENMICDNNISVYLYILAAPTKLLEYYQNIFHKCHININNFIPKIIAKNEIILRDNKYSKNHIVLDFNYKATSFMIYASGRIAYISHFPSGDQNIISDISSILSIDNLSAAKLKILYGTIYMNNDQIDKPIKLSEVSQDHYTDDTIVLSSTLSEIIKTRMEKTLLNVRHRLAKLNITNYNKFNILLTGNSTSIIGLKDLASMIFNKNIIIANIDERASELRNIDIIGNEISHAKYMISVGAAIYTNKLNARQTRLNKNNSFDKISKKFNSLMKYIL